VTGGGSHQSRGLHSALSLLWLVMSAHVELQATRRTKGDVPGCRTAVTEAGASSRAAYGSTIQVSCRGSASARHRLTHPAGPVALQIGVDACLKHRPAIAELMVMRPRLAFCWYLRSQQSVKMN